MKLDKITFVTGNKAKIEETREILKVNLEIKDIELDEIQGLDLEKVALHKINQAYEIVKSPVMIDDVSFEIEVWNKFPGPLIKWILKAGKGPSLILKLMEGEKNRKASAKLAIGFHDGKKAHIFFGEAKGSVGYEVAGKEGFGWDKIFIPDGYDKTYAEMSSELKNSISHRFDALSKLNDFLNKNYEV